MDDLQNRLGAILNNPQLMGQLMSMAQSLGQSQPKAPPPPPRPAPQPMPELSLLQGFMNPAQLKPDKAQQNLLQALRPFLAAERLARLERALQAARLAQMAAMMLGQSGNPPQGKQVNHV